MAENVGAEALLGVAGIGAGILLLYGAYKNVSIFGPKGLLAVAIQTGTFPATKDLPPMFGPLEILYHFPSQPGVPGKPDTHGLSGQNPSTPAPRQV